MALKKLALLTNVTIDMIAAKLRKECDVYVAGGYNAWVPEVLNDNSALYATEHDIIFVLLDGTELRGMDTNTSVETMNLWEQAIGTLLEKFSDKPVFVSTIDARVNRILAMNEKCTAHFLENAWEQALDRVTGRYSNCFIYDLKEAVCDIGRNTFYSEKMWYLGSMPYSKEGIVRISGDILKLIKRCFGPAKKVIVTDLDNTLWGGVAGEDGLDGIVLSAHNEGQRFYDFQKQLLEMKKRGALLAICSKNNVEDVKKIFDEHPYMVLKWDDFVIKKINWNTKVQNIREMEQELNLTEGSFLFIDDNPMERELVSGECPEVAVLDFPTDTTELIRFAEEFYADWFKQQRVLKEDVGKTAMYIAEAQRKAVQTEAPNLEEYIRKLEIQADIHRMRDSEVARVAQLCNKTNQFNVTTKRYTESDIRTMASNPDVDIFVALTEDRFGNDGLVAVVIVQYDEHRAVIDSFLMSCRVMGKKLEQVIASEIFRYIKVARKTGTVDAMYIPTEKNAPVASLFEDLGFELMKSSETSKEYTKNLEDWNYSENGFYKKVTFDCGE